MAAASLPADVPMKASAGTSPDPKTTIEAAPKPATALTPPTSEEMNHEETKKEHDDSELSDLDLDEDELEDIEPDHYWDNGRVPVFKPTMDQFRSFKKFVDKIDKYGMKSGIVKVIPPKEWRDSLPNLDDAVKGIKIKNPITQEFNGTQGIYTQQNVEKQRSYNLPEWKSLTEETSHQPPAKRGERRRHQEKVVRGGGNLRGRTTATPVAEVDDAPKPKRKPGRPARRPAKADEDADAGEETKGRRSSRNTQVPPTPDSPATKPAPKPKGRQPRGGGQGQAKSVTSRRLNNTAEKVDYVDEEAFQEFDYKLDDLDEFTPERCAELEAHYWKSLGFNQPMYAADMPGSLFEDDTTSWNVAHLENLLDVLGTKVPGVNTAYLYMGMWKATFAWHLEDVDLYSINYIHFGAPKQWYSISQEDARKFEKAMKSVWPVDAKNCDQFLRHKTYLISPDVLQKQYGVKVNKLVHYEGEFVITFPYGYHSGYNIGYNCAESVNFATESWLEYGRIARKCHCETDNVWVDVNEIERKLRGEPTPEYIEETDDESDMDEDGNLPSPPASVKGKPASKKRKRGAKEEKPKKKKKIRIKLRVPTREPCCMCPNDNPWEQLLPTDNGKKAHKSCALYTPETFVVKSDDGFEKVCGVTTIDRARLDLKCNFCRSKRGACFQCSSKKCTRAFHATCALAAGVLIDCGVVPTFGEDGTEYFEEGYDFRCKYHRPKMPKNLNVESLEKSSRINNYAKEVKYNDVVQAQLIGGEVFAGLVVENRPSEMSLVVDVLPEGYVQCFAVSENMLTDDCRDRVEIEYKWLCILDPDDSQRQKPTSAAIAMPEGLNRKALSISNRQDGVPDQGQPFYENPDYKWHDFYNMDMPPPGYVSSKVQAPLKLNIKLDSPDQLYFYLGDPSTEAKSFFTDKAGTSEVAAKANFLDRVQPSKPVYQYHASKQPIQPAKAVPIQRQNHFSAVPTANMRSNNNDNSNRPYIYKPKDQMQAHNYRVDAQSLANQQNFLADSSNGRRMSQTYGPQHSYQNADMSLTSGPLRAFPTDHYYSMRTLPAAVPGEYSSFTNAVRRVSHGQQSMQRPTSQHSGYVPNYQSIGQQQANGGPGQGRAPVAQMMAASPPPPNPYESNGSRPTSSAQSYHSPYGAPLTPATTHSATSGHKHADGSSTDDAYLASLQKYPYLFQSYCRKPKVYESPYPLGGGFSAAYQAQLQSTTEDQRRRSIHTPRASMSVPQDRRGSQPWTPPSQIWDKAGLRLPSPPPPQHFHGHGPPPRRVPGPTYSTPAEFQQQIQSMPSTASREGAQARALRDQGYIPYQHQHPRNSFGQAYDTAMMWQSPKAPTPSPLSDPNTPGQVAPGHKAWGTLPRLEQKILPRPAPAQTGYGPAHTPQMGSSNGSGGHETWRYG
ncbi:uncharacterized protein LTR77_002737 [Saxophila tyrrhenica]|uniref:[histone H3]-trimethyl-L-lysine(9) demethylase n=1 Tax=Saxophila tyrrhenica TaxID=1690608 RepID=A0AAV9PFW4_9PEZI|nr:hypothetical protein LTR77_002737 [Saxophila tyrrhenica]